MLLCDSPNVAAVRMFVVVMTLIGVCETGSTSNMALHRKQATNGADDSSTQASPCDNAQCSVDSTIQQGHNISSDGECSDSGGWNLRGSDWGCCGNYEGCCTYASFICYIHDALCRCCDVGEDFCGPLCKPEAHCSTEADGHEANDTTSTPVYSSIQINTSQPDLEHTEGRDVTGNVPVKYWQYRNDLNTDSDQGYLNISDVTLPYTNSSQQSATYQSTSSANQKQPNSTHEYSDGQVSEKFGNEQFDSTNSSHNYNDSDGGHFGDIVGENAQAYIVNFTRHSNTSKYNDKQGHLDVTAIEESLTDDVIEEPFDENYFMNEKLLRDVTELLFKEDAIEGSGDAE